MLWITFPVRTLDVQRETCQENEALYRKIQEL